ncbi:hypothetical protein GpartN1_g1641.t1 [Galdieria partita]|uniref:Fucosyltransferase n=1 Tax=Galdieria partita TaxID=83374 RepID=A0A9C7UNU4_9RHOD|nr:hypothetical protein GpartN1_g1641.t1 [Galdieria partita]
MLALDFDQLFSLEKDGYKKRYWHKVVNMVTNYGGIWIPLVVFLGLWLLEQLVFLALQVILHKRLLLGETSCSTCIRRSPRKKSCEGSNAAPRIWSSTNAYWNAACVFFEPVKIVLSQLVRVLKRVLFLYSYGRKSFTRRIVQTAIIFFALYLFLELEIFREPRSSRRMVHRVLPSICNDSQIHLPHGVTHFRDNYFETFKQLHTVEYQKILRHQNLEAGRSVVFVASCDGLGNRFMGLLSAFLFAVLANRAFFVLWEPCGSTVGAQLDDLFDTPGFDWNFVELAAQLGIDSSQLEDYPHRLIFTQYCRPCPFWRPIRDMEPIACSSYDEAFPENLIIFRATHWLGPAMQHNPYYRQFICTHFGSQPFPQLATALLTPSKRVYEIMEPYRQLIKTSRRVVGLQIRLRDSYAIDEYSEQVMWRCAESILSHWDQVASPESFLKRNGSTGLVDRWFIATDTPEAREQLRLQLGEKLISMDPPMDKGKTESAQWALAEMWLLGEADEIIISPYSSFGLFGHGRTGKAPWIVDRKGRCWRTPNSAPCDFYWFGVQRLKCFRDEWLTAEMVNNDDCFG